MKKFLIILVFLSTCCTLLRAQVGDHRNDFAIGVNGGYVLSNITFQPEVSQAFHGGVSGGLSFRYICEKYFKSICSIYAEVNYASVGWKEDILDAFGFYLSESTKTNFTYENALNTTPTRSNQVIAQDSMAIENKFDYGIALGGGIEYSHPKVGHFLAEARYYYGLGNIYGSSKRDYFSASRYGQIVFKLTYLFDIVKTKNNNIK